MTILLKGGENSMQGMMIQDISINTRSSAPVAAKATKETAEKPFGALLGAEIVPVKTAPNRGSSAKSSSVTPEKTAEDRDPAVEPVFMGTLFSQTAPFVNISEENELVSVAERTQELLGGWMKSDKGGDASLEEVVTTALKVLDLAAAGPQLQSSAVAGAEDQPPVLDSNKIAELKELMAVMLQSGAVPQAFEGHPVVAELQQKLGLTQAFAAAPPVSQAQSGVAAQALAGVQPAASTQPAVAVKPVDAEQVEALAQPTATVQPKAATAENVERVQTAAVGKSAQDAEFRAASVQATGQQQVQVVASGEVKKPAELGLQPSAGLQENQMARMLRPRSGQPTAHMAQAAKNAAAAETVRTEPVADGQSTVATETELKLKSDLTMESVKPVVLPQSGDIQPQQGLHLVGATARQGGQIDLPAARMLQLPSGLQLAETQVVDQVITHLAGSADGESGRIRLRLYPAELGSIRLDLLVEGDRVRAHLQAQSQQVQEVLDRHLPLLRDALQQQGLKIDEFRVDVQTNQDQASQDFAWQQSQQRERSSQSPWRDSGWQKPEIEIPLQQLVQTTGGGISLRV